MDRSDLKVLLALANSRDEKRLRGDLDSLGLRSAAIWDPGSVGLANRDDASLDGVGVTALRTYAYRAGAGLLLLDTSYPSFWQVGFGLGAQPVFCPVAPVESGGSLQGLIADVRFPDALSDHVIPGFVAAETSEAERRKGLDSIVDRVLAWQNEMRLDVGDPAFSAYAIDPSFELRMESVRDLLAYAIRELNTASMMVNQKKPNYDAARRSLTSAFNVLDHLERHPSLDLAILAEGFETAQRYAPAGDQILLNRKEIAALHDKSRDSKDAVREMKVTLLLRGALPTEGILLDSLRKDAGVFPPETRDPSVNCVQKNLERILATAQTICEQSPSSPWSRYNQGSVRLNQVAISRRFPIQVDGHLDFDPTLKVSEEALRYLSEPTQRFRVIYERGVAFALSAEDLAMRGYDSQAQESIRQAFREAGQLQSVDDLRWAAHLEQGRAVVHTAAFVAALSARTPDRAAAEYHLARSVASFLKVERKARRAGARGGMLISTAYANLATLAGLAAIEQLEGPPKFNLAKSAVQYASCLAEHTGRPFDQRFQKTALFAFGDNTYKH